MKISDFNKHFYDSRVWERTYYKSIPIAKNPCDLWIYQEIIFETRPNILIECGTGYGASALYFVDTMKNSFIAAPLVITVDVNKNFITNANIKQVIGSSINPDTLNKVRDSIPTEGFSLFPKIMVVLDSNHEYEHVLEELKLYHKFVTKGCYLVVEDTNNEHYREGRGCREAVEDFMSDQDMHNKFLVDYEREKFGLTFNSGGFLKCLT